MRKRFTTFIALLNLVCWAGSLPAKDLTIKKVADSIVDPAALHFTNGTWGLCVNGQTFQQDALTSYQGWQYATYYDAGRRLCVARRKSGAANWETIRFTDHLFKGNDTHNVAVIGICARDGTIHLAFDHHGSPLHYRVSRAGVALRPKDFPWIAELFGATTSELEPGKKLSRVTYPRFLRTPDGRLQFSYRIGGSGDGGKFLADYDPDHAQWINFGEYIGSTGMYEKSSSRNPYLNGLTYDRQGRVHATWCWRESGDPMTNHDLDYAWSDDRGRNWFNNAGQQMGERGRKAITLDAPGVRVVELGMNRGLANATTQAVDSQDRIHLVTFHLPDDAPRQADWETTREKARYFHYWRASDGKWQRNEMNFIGSRPQLWFDKNDNAYVVFVGDRFNPSPELSIAAASAKSRWADWKVIYSERGPFSGQPQVDRHGQSSVLSVYIQESSSLKPGTASPLRVMDFKP